MQKQPGTAYRWKLLLHRVVAWLIAGALMDRCPIAFAATVADTKHVVVLYPESDGRPGNLLVDRGIHTALRSYTAGPVEVYNEYLDLTRFSDEHSQQHLATFLSEKYEGLSVDVVIPCMGHALDFVLKYRAALFSNVPVVFCAVEHSEAEARALGTDVIGVPMKFDLAPTLELALRLHPKTRQIYVVAGASQYDTAWEAKARQVFRSYESQFKFEYLSALSKDVLLTRVAQLADHSVIYYLHVFRDGAGKTLGPTELLEELAAVANVPTYGHADTYVGRGIVGGRPISFEANGWNAGRLAVRILNGEKPQAIGVSEPSHNDYQFDWRQLRRWGIDEKQLPPGSIVLFKQPTFWDLYKWHALGITSLCVIETLLIVGLLVQWSRRWRSEKELRVSYQRQRDLAGRLLTAQEGERRRIARELHDDLNQGLALLTVELELLGQRPPESGTQFAQQLRELTGRVKELSTSVHNLSHQLHPSKLEQLGLVAAVRSLCKELADGHGVPIEFVHNELPKPLSDEVVICIYRIAQEALANIIRHSGAHQARVELRHDAKAIHLKIVDDGVGFDPQRASDGRGIGLGNMRERLHLVHGEIVIDSKPSTGTRIQVRVPLDSTAPQT